MSLFANVTNLTNDLQSVKDNVDVFFLLTMSIFVYTMQCGFAFLEAGAVRSKNVTNILLKNILDSCFSAFAYWGIGWAFAYGKHSNAFIGYSDFFHADLDHGKFHLWFFQFTFAAAASTIVSGAVAERCEFVAYVAYCTSLTGFIYPVVSHWAWDDTGWLKVLGYVDFAGSGVVHLVGGTASLMGAIALGPRVGRFSRKTIPLVDIKGHSVPFVALGGFMLIAGFFAFNGGSQLHISKPGDGAVVATAMVNTMLSCASAGLFTLFAGKIVWKRWSLLVTLNGALTGMVSICAGCDAYYTYAAVTVGAVAAASYLFWSWVMVKVKVDDPLDAFAVHAGGGFWGVVACSLFHNQNGVFYWRYGHGTFQEACLFFAYNLLGAIVIICWTASLSGLLFVVLKYSKLLRVSYDVEIKGLDIFKHCEPSYPSVSYGHGYGAPWDQVMDWSTVATETLRRIEEAKGVKVVKPKKNGHHNGEIAPPIPHSVSEPSNAARFRIRSGETPEVNNIFYQDIYHPRATQELSYYIENEPSDSNAHPHAYNGPAALELHSEDGSTRY